MIILARESGLRLDLADLPIRSLVPEPLKVHLCIYLSKSAEKSLFLHLMFFFIYFQGCASAEEFMEKLPQYDEDIAKERLEAENSGEVK